MKKIINILIGSLAPVLLFSQTRIVFDGANITITNGAKLVLQNPSPNALTVLSTGGIVSDDATSNVLWNIGTNAASYVVPFISNSNPIPLSFTTSGATGNGLFTLSTYAGPNWQNSNYLPPTVTNVNSNGTDNSNYVIDRFWQIQTSGYATNPSISNLVFAYNENEWSETGNNIDEPDLTAQSWNAASSIWTPVTGTDNPSTNVVTVAAVAGSDLNTWWTLVDKDDALPVSLISFTAQLANKQTQLQWITAQELNSSYFDVQRSQDGASFIKILSVPAMGNSSLHHTYNTVDKNPLNGINYYRLKQVDINGDFAFSPVVHVTLNNGNAYSVFPNPASGSFYLNINVMSAKESIIGLYDVSGRLLQEKDMQLAAGSNQMQWDISQYAKGTYFLRAADNSMPVIKIVKQ